MASDETWISLQEESASTGSRADDQTLLLGTHGRDRGFAPRRSLATVTTVGLLAVGLIACFVLSRLAVNSGHSPDGHGFSISHAPLQSLYGRPGVTDIERDLDLPQNPHTLEPANGSARSLQQAVDKALGALYASATWLSDAFDGFQTQVKQSSFMWDDEPKDRFSEAFGRESTDTFGVESMSRGGDSLLSGSSSSRYSDPAQDDVLQQGTNDLLDNNVKVVSDAGDTSKRGGSLLADPIQKQPETPETSRKPNEQSSEVAWQETAKTAKTAKTTTTTTTTTTTLSMQLWEVVFPGPVNVRRKPNFEADVKSVMWKCTRFFGNVGANGWVHVLSDDGQDLGYLKTLYKNRSLAREVLDPQGRSLIMMGTEKDEVKHDKYANSTGKCQRCSMANQCSSMEWQVKHNGPTPVYESATNNSKIIDYKWKCDLVSGVRLKSWVKLTRSDGPDGVMQPAGFMQLEDDDGTPNLLEVTAIRPEDTKCETCIEDNEHDCSAAGCCKNPGAQCYKKDEGGGGSCQYVCNPKEDGSGCDKIGDRSWTPGFQGFPTIFCFSLIRPASYEEDLMRAQIAAGAGMFACDAFTVLSPSELSLGVLRKTKQEVKTVYTEPAPVGISKDGTAANTQIFFNAWDAIKQEGKYEKYAWTIKMDPDAVLIPDRVRVKFMSRWLNGFERKVYFANCNRFADAPEFPMMYGAMEVLSQAATKLYLEEGYKCMSMPYQDWGEDLYLAKCLREVLGVERIFESTMVGDSRCMGGACWDHAFSAFHEFKNVEGWFGCWNTTAGAL
jgi:hypothetical protein